MLEKLPELIEPLLQDLGYELVHLELQGQGRGSLLRIYIEHRARRSEDGVVQRDEITLEDCERVSREVSALLDVSDPIPHAYRLEISSPGLDRPLTKVADFSRFAGHRARVTLYAPFQERRRFSGVLDGVDEQGQVCMRVDGQRLALPIADIQKARLVPELD